MTSPDRKRLEAQLQHMRLGYIHENYGDLARKAAEKVRAIGLQAGHSGTYQMPPRTGAPRDTTRKRVGRTGLSPPLPRTATAKLRSMSMFFAIGFGRATQRLLGKWAERTPTPAEAPRRQEPGPRGADAYQTHPKQESNAGHGGGVPSGEDKQADKARP
jgi:hypothetical protein